MPMSKRPTRRLHVGPDQFGALLVFLMLAFVVSGFELGGWQQAIGMLANIAAILAGFSASGLWADRVRIIALVSIGAVGAVLVGMFEQDSPAAGFGALGQVVLLTGVLLAVIRRVLGHDHVGPATIAGAIAAYFLLGLAFAWLYQAAYGFLEPPLLHPEATGLPAYYSFVVLTTLGFGDIAPVNELVRRVTAVEAIAGQIFLATLVARLVSVYGSSIHRQ